MPAKARVCAYAVLRRVFEQGAYADLALHAEARELDARDRALAMRLAYGAVQRRGTLDHLIERLAERPLERLDAPVLAALRLGLYELLYLGGAPDHAVVADAVELAKAGARGGHGLVNAVLRRAAREGAARLAELDDGTPEAAALKHSHPGVDRTALVGAAGRRGCSCADGVRQPAGGAGAAREHAASPNRRALRSSCGRALDRWPSTATRASPRRSCWRARWTRTARRNGARARSWRSRAARCSPHGCWRPQPGERVLDLCAAPGGKSTHLAALMGGRAKWWRSSATRVAPAELRRTVERLRAQECMRVVLGDAAQPRRDEAPFDRVLVDPPCSGLGTLQARADLRWRVAPEDRARLARMQAAILAAGAAAVRPGGVLVYSTCTISATENEHQIAAFP